MDTIFTIGSSGKTAEKFFNLLDTNHVKTLVDVRLNNTSQLAGFTKKGNLAYFLDKICGIRYAHMPELAPTSEILKDYQKKLINWTQYEQAFASLLGERKLEAKLRDFGWDGACLLCSEKTPEFCHRRLVAEYIKNLGIVGEIVHII